MNTDPSPYLLSTEMTPPIISARRLVMVSPRPVPSIFRLRCRSNRWKPEKRFSISSLWMPIPVSFTASVSRMPAETASPLTDSVTLPSSVYFTALVSRFMMIWRIRTSSPIRQSGVSSSTLMITSSPFRSARYSTIFTTSFNTVLSLYSPSTSCILPDSILEKSRMSLTRERSDSPARLMFQE